MPGVDTHEWTVASVGVLLFGPAYLPSYPPKVPSSTHITRLRDACYVRSRGLGPVISLDGADMVFCLSRIPSSQYRAQSHLPTTTLLYEKDTIVGRTCMVEETIPAYRGRLKL